METSTERLDLMRATPVSADGERARQLLDHGDLVTAMNLCRAGAKTKPEQLWPLVLGAAVFQSFDRSDSACRNLHWAMTVLEQGTASSPSVMVDLASWIKDLVPMNSTIAMKSGEVLFSARRFAEARAMFERALELSPDYKPALDNLRRCDDVDIVEKRRKARAMSPINLAAVKTDASGAPTERQRVSAIWAELALAAIRHYRAITPASLHDEVYLNSGFRTGPVTPAQVAALARCFDPAYLSTNPQELERLGGRHDARLYRPYGEVLEGVRGVFEALAPAFEHCMQSRFRIESVIFREMTLFNQDAAFSWHRDGYPVAIRRALIWLDPPAEVGGTELFDMHGNHHLIEETSPTWLLFDNSVCGHIGHFKGKMPRRTVDITFSPAFETDVTPRVISPVHLHTSVPSSGDVHATAFERYCGDAVKAAIGRKSEPEVAPAVGDD